MAGRGVYFALSSEEHRDLLAAASDEDVMTVIEEIEDAWDSPWLTEVDKAWDAMHRCLGDGTLDAGEGPFSWAVLGGESRHQGEDHIVSYVSPTGVIQVAQQLNGITQRWFSERYQTLRAAGYEGPHGADDLTSTWSSFLSVRALFTRAAREGRAMIFTVDP